MRSQGRCTALRHAQALALPMPAYALRPSILVTSGAGFLGSHLCERLLAAGNDVQCVDNFFTGTKDNIAHLLGHRGQVHPAMIGP